MKKLRLTEDKSRSLWPSGPGRQSQNSEPRPSGVTAHALSPLTFAEAREGHPAGEVLKTGTAAPLHAPVGRGCLLLGKQGPATSGTWQALSKYLLSE